jgi:fucose permease
MQTPAPPWPVFLAAFGIGGMGLSIQDSQANGYVAALEDKTLMGILHAAYGTRSHTHIILDPSAETHTFGE